VSEVAAILWSEADRLYSSRLAYPEARAALAVSLRANRSNASQHSEAKAELERLPASFSFRTRRDQLDLVNN
jgi:hypothetical protein